MHPSFLQIESYKKGIVLSLGFNSLSKILGFATNLVIAYYLGAQSATDVYFYCLGTVILMAGFATSLDTPVLIPESMRLTAQKSQQDAMAFLNAFLYLFIVGGILLTVALWTHPVRVFSAVSRFDARILEANADVVTLAVPLFLLLLLTTYMTDILTSYKFFTLPTIISSINSVISLTFLAVFHARLGVRSLLIGLLVAYSLHLCFLAYLLVVGLHWRFSSAMVIPDRRILKNIVFALAGNVTSLLASFVPLFLLSGFSDGIITALNYGQRVADLPTVLVTAQFSSVAGIKFNELYARRDWNRINEVFLSSIKLLTFVLVPMSLFLAVYGTDIITILFKRGAFTDSSAANAGMFLRYLCLLIPLLAVNTIVSRLFMAAQKIFESFWYQILFNLALIPLMAGGVSLWGPRGFPLAMLGLHVLNVLACYFLLRAFFPMIQYTSFLVYLAKILVVNLPVALGIYFFKSAIPGMSILLNLSLAIIVYGLVLSVMNQWLRLNTDVRQLIAAALGRGRAFFSRRSSYGY